MKKEGDLFFKNGKAYLKETGAAYCGQYKVVFEFNDYCVFEYLNGEEIKRSIYTSESILQSETYLHNNEKTKAIIFSETGKKKFEHSYSHGQLDGLSKIYDENENLFISMNFKNGRLHGEKVVLDENGVIKQRFNYENGIEVK